LPVSLWRAQDDGVRDVDADARPGGTVREWSVERVVRHEGGVGTAAHRRRSGLAASARAAAVTIVDVGGSRG
jgi:hypothetical protein